MSGAFGQNYNCMICKQDNTRMGVWGCHERTKMCKPTMVDDEDGTYYWSCPIRFIPQSVWDFVRIHKFYHDHPSAVFPSFDQVSPRYLQAESILSYEMQRGI